MRYEGMHKPTLTRDEFLDALNRELKNDRDYVDGMEFLPSPSDAPGREALGYDFGGPSEHAAIYSRVFHLVNDRYDLKF